jgi:hypothetical protein
MPSSDDQVVMREVARVSRVQVGEKWGYLDKTGKIVIAPQFRRAFDFSGGIAEVSTDKGWAYIGKSGKLVWIPTR